MNSALIVLNYPAVFLHFYSGGCINRLGKPKHVSEEFLTHCKPLGAFSSKPIIINLLKP